jgi:DMSO/TMAO reductase YedYZ molybdopterin-dependent catalytic subunit
MLVSATPLRSVFTRRRFLRQAGVAGAGGWLALAARAAEDTVRFPFENGERPLVQYPQKRPLIRITTRPPQLETPFSVFNEGILTPNDAFFVRYHLSEIPLEVDPDAFRLEIKGSVGKPLKLSLADLRSEFEAVELVAVNQCSGNGRGFFNPRVGGGQMGNGAMGNARWKGVRLKDVLDKAGVKAGAKQVAFKGLDRPVIEKTPEFVKALDLDHARDGEVMLAWEMNGAELPMLNGYPLRLVVPGYYGTYWIKHLNEITVLDGEFAGFWMQSAYRIPDNETASVPPGTTPAKTVPIKRFNVRSFITSLADGAKVPAARSVEVKGIAFDGGSGIKQVQFSADGGKTWKVAQLAGDEGRYSFRGWSATFAAAPGPSELKCRATNNAGEAQPFDPLWNPAGYMRNVVESTHVEVI